MQARIVIRPEIPNFSEIQAKARVSLQVVAFLLTPLALMAGALAFWRFGIDIDWTSEFPIEAGFFSHWQVWLGLAAGLQVAGRRLRGIR